MSEVKSSSSSFDAGFEGDYRFKLNGGGGADPNSGEFIPEDGYLRFSVTGPTTIKVWASSGGLSERSLYETDKTSVLAEQTMSNSSTFLS